MTEVNRDVIAEVNKGVIVDWEGFYIAAIEWPALTKRPQINEPSTPKDKRNKMLPAAFFDENAEFKRFDFVAETWVEPTEEASVVSTRGDFLKSVPFFKGYEHRLPVLTPSEEYVFVPRPLTERTFQWIWSGSEWIKPVKVAIVRDGKITSCVLQNPRADQPDLKDIMPDVDVYEDWPKLPSGEYARIGASLVDGKWVNPVRVVTDDEIVKEADRRMKALVEGYSAIQRETWDNQYNEALEVLGNPSTSNAPMLAALARGRNITLVAMAERVKAKKDHYTSAVSDILEKQAELLLRDNRPENIEDDEVWS